MTVVTGAGIDDNRARNGVRTDGNKALPTDGTIW